MKRKRNGVKYVSKKKTRPELMAFSFWELGSMGVEQSEWDKDKRGKRSDITCE